jgi:hypothetical protein
LIISALKSKKADAYKLYKGNDTCAAVGSHVALILVEGSFSFQTQVDEQLQQLHQKVSHAGLEKSVAMKKNH